MFRYKRGKTFSAFGRNWQVIPKSANLSSKRPVTNVTIVKKDLKNPASQQF